MFNPMHPELALVLHRERVDAGLRRAARRAERADAKPPDQRYQTRRRFHRKLRLT
jgi:hypothetical protein